MKTTNDVRRQPPPPPPRPAETQQRPPAPKAETQPPSGAPGSGPQRDSLQTGAPAAKPVELAARDALNVELPGGPAAARSPAGGEVPSQLEGLSLTTQNFGPEQPPEAGPVGETPPAPAEPQQGMTEPQREEARQSIREAQRRGDAAPMAEWLEKNQDPKAQEEYVNMMFEMGAVPGDNSRLTESQKATLSGAIGRAYESGSLTDAEVKAAIKTGSTHGEPGSTHEVLGELIGRTHNEGLIRAYVAGESAAMKGSKVPGADANRAIGMAQALSGLSGEGLQRFLESEPGQFQQMVDGLGFKGGYGEPVRRSPALGNLLETAATIRPPTEESLSLFDQAIPLVGSNPESRAGAARFMVEHGDAVYARYTDESGSLTVHGQEKLSELFAQTLFSDPPYEGREQLKTSVLNRMKALHEKVEAGEGQNPPSPEALMAARGLGSLIGVVEGGFQVAVEQLDAENAATDSMVDMMFQATDLIPGLPFPGGSILKNQGVGAAKAWLKEQLHQKADDPKRALPFHESFSQGIKEPLRTSYDAARGEAYDNRAIGLTR